MKKFFIGLFAGLVAVFGSISSIGSKSSFDNFNDFKTVQNAVVETVTNEYTFYLENGINKYDLNTSLDILNPNNDNSSVEIIKKDLSLITLSSTYSVSFNINAEELFDGFFMDNYVLAIKMGIDLNEGNFNIVANTWYYMEYDINGDLSSVYEVIGIRFINFVIPGTSSLEGMNDFLNPYIGDLTSFPSDEPTPPSPPSQNFLDDITSTINGVIDWFVDLFNGLADIFVIYDSNGSFVGFSLWGNVLFIEVSIILVVIVLRWVISLIRGI